jgi:hypothetical protein
MNIRDDDQVSAVALIVDSEATAAPVLGDEPLPGVTAPEAGATEAQATEPDVDSAPEADSPPDADDAPGWE